MMSRPNVRLVALATVAIVAIITGGRDGFTREQVDAVIDQLTDEAE